VEKIELIWKGILTLDKATISKLDDNISGIYRLSYKHIDTNIYVNYVGKTDDLKKQLLLHISKEETNTCIKGFQSSSTCYFKYAQIKEGIQKDIAYGLLHNFYQPNCNTDKPMVDENFTINVN